MAMVRPFIPSVCIAVSAAGAALGQSVPSNQVLPQRVEQGVGDVGPLNASLRHLDADLRVDTGFDHVYRTPTNSSQAGKFMRSSGGLVAVFPQSEYVNAAGVMYPVLPAGTVFYIGMPPTAKPTHKQVAEVRPRESSNLALERMSSQQKASGLPPIREGMADEAYRRNLLWRLADREMALLADSDETSSEQR